METKIEIGSCRGEVMKRSELESFIMETYNAEADYPWLKYPHYDVFRHCKMCIRASCVAVCPKKARNYSKLVSFIAGLKMKKVCSGRKENKLYL